MTQRFVTDTNCLIFYFHDVFDVENRLTASTRALFDNAFISAGDILLSIPSVVLVEIFEKWFLTEEFAAKFHYEVFERIIAAENIEIKPIDKEVIENILKLGGAMESHDLHDKIILACAMMLDCQLITVDGHITEYVNTNHIIPGVRN